MKRAAVLLIAFAAMLPAQISQHLQGGLVDAQIASYRLQEPDIPGMEPVASNFVAVSFTSSDAYVEAFIVVMRIQLEDGTIAPVCQIVPRASTGNTVVRFAIPGKPVKIDKLYIERYHAEPRDVLVK